MKEWLTRKEVCDMLGIGMTTLGRYMTEKRFPYYKNGTYRSAKTRFKTRDILEYIKKTKVN